MHRREDSATWRRLCETDTNLWQKSFYRLRFTSLVPMSCTEPATPYYIKTYTYYSSDTEAPTSMTVVRGSIIFAKKNRTKPKKCSEGLKNIPSCRLIANWFFCSGYQELLLESSFIFSRLGVKTGFEHFVVTWLDQLSGQCTTFLKMAVADFAGQNESWSG